MYLHSRIYIPTFESDTDDKRSRAAGDWSRTRMVKERERERKRNIEEVKRLRGLGEGDERDKRLR